MLTLKQTGQGETFQSQILSASRKSSSFWGKLHLMCLVQAGLLATKLPLREMLLRPLPEETHQP